MAVGDGARGASDVEAALSATFGAVPDIAAPSRDEWRRDLADRAELTVGVPGVGVATDPRNR